MRKTQVSYQRFGVYIADMNPTKGHEIAKTRPVVIVSPEEMNEHLATVIIAPLTTKIRDNYPFRPRFDLQDTENQIALDQIRCVDKTRLMKRIGELPLRTAQEVVESLHAMFAF